MIHTFPYILPRNGVNGDDRTVTLSSISSAQQARMKFRKSLEWNWKQRTIEKIQLLVGIARFRTMRTMRIGEKYKQN